MSDPTAATSDAVSERLMPAAGAVRRLLLRLAGPTFPDEPVSPSQREVIIAVGRHPGSAVAEIAHELGLAPNSVSTIVTQLVSAGLLVRETDPLDRRIGRLRLTERAHEQFVAAKARRRGVLHEALDRLTADQLAALAEGIDTLDLLAEELRNIQRERGTVVDR